MDDPLVYCPFDLAHTCKQSRFQKHLIKCRKNHPESKLEPCPYNATEYIHPDNLIEHLKVCKNAKLLEGQKYSAKLHRENYLDAPFHMPKGEVESEDFEGQEVNVNDSDERVLERSVSQMSLNSMGSTHLLEGNDNNVSCLTPINIKNRGTSELPSRSSTVRSVGRGHAMAKLISVLHQMDEMDYSKYEIKSTVTHDEPQGIDAEFAPPSKFDPVHHGNISLFERKQEEDQSKFQDSSSEEELEAHDNVSICSSKSTIIENNCTSIENNRLSWAATPEPVKTVSLYSEDDETHISDLAIETLNSPVKFNRQSENVLSVNCISVCREASADIVLNKRDSSSSFSFYSLIQENLLQNDMRVRGLENEERSMNRGRGRGYRNQNCPFRNDGTRFERGEARSPSGGGRSAMLNAICNFDAQSNNMNNRDRSQYFNQNGYQNCPNRLQQAHSNYNNHGSHANRSSPNYHNSSNQDHYPQSPYSNQSNEGSHYNRDQNSYRKLTKLDENAQQVLSNQSNQGACSNPNRMRGSFNEASTIGRGSHNQMNSFGPSNLYPSDSVGRGNLSQRLNQLGSGNASYPNHSIGRGKLLIQGSTNSSSRGSFQQENFLSKGSFQLKDNLSRKTSPYHQEQFNASGNYHNEGIPFSRQDFSNQQSSLGGGNSLDQAQSIGRGNSFNRVHSDDRGNHSSQENQLFNQTKSIGRGNMSASWDNSEGQPSPVGRGRLLMSLGVSQFTNCRNNESVGCGWPTTPNHYSEMDNFKGKSNEIFVPSFEAVYNSFKDLQVSDYSPIPSPKQINGIAAPRPFAQVTSHGSPMSLLSPSFSSAEPKVSKINPTVPKKNNSKMKKKKNKRKQTSLKSSVVNSSTQSVTNAEGTLKAPSGPNFKILDKSMDPKKYFGADNDNKVNSNQDNKKTSANQDSEVISGQHNKASSNQNNHNVNSKQSKSKAYLKQNNVEINSKQGTDGSKATPKQCNSKANPKRDSNKAKPEQNSSKTNPKQDSSKANPKQNSSKIIFKRDSSKNNFKQSRSKVNSKQGSIKAKSKENNIAHSKQNVSDNNLKVSGNVFPRAPNCNDTKFMPNDRVAAINRENKFQIYDQFYSNMSYGNFNSQVNFNYNPMNQNKFNYQGTMAQSGRFSGRMVDDRQNQQKSYASVNCIYVSEKPLESISACNIPCSSPNVGEVLAFSSLHQPQKPRLPGRYDKLSGTGYKFLFRQLNRKQKVSSHMPKLVRGGKKVYNQLSMNQPISEVKKLYDPLSGNINPPSISKVSQAKKSSNPSIVKVNPPNVSNTKEAGNTALKTGISLETLETESVKRKSNQYRKIYKNTNVPQETKVFHSQRKNKHFDENTRSDMSLWNKKSYSKISASDESSFNPSFKPQMGQWASQTSFANDFQSNSSVKTSPVDKFNFYPFSNSPISPQNFKMSKSGHVKNTQSKKHGFVVMKEKINNKEKKFKPKNFDQSRARLRYPNGFNFLSLMPSSPFEKPLVFGPPHSTS